jgi:hypothetical protein
LNKPHPKLPNAIESTYAKSQAPGNIEVANVPIKTSTDPLLKPTLWELVTAMVPDANPDPDNKDEIVAIIGFTSLLKMANGQMDSDEISKLTLKVVAVYKTSKSTSTIAEKQSSLKGSKVLEVSYAEIVDTASNKVDPETDPNVQSLLQQPIPISTTILILDLQKQ